MGETQIINHARFENGKLVLPQQHHTLNPNDSRLDYLHVLKAVRDIPFGVGKKLLIDYLQGKEDNPSIKKNRLHRYPSFATLAYEPDELTGLINNLINHDYLTYTTLQHNKRWKVLQLTEKGQAELIQPTFYKQKINFQENQETPTQITKEDQLLFDRYADFLQKYNDQQKKAIINTNTHILCIAGAGTGKTTVLTQRIRFLIQHKGIAPQEILAITFTRKARQEMQHRLTKAGIHGVQIETFNSYCEKELKTHNDLIYTNKTRVLNYRDKIHIIHTALGKLNRTMQSILSLYFTKQQQTGKTPEELATIFINDCFQIRDYFKATGDILTPQAFHTRTVQDRTIVDLFIGIINYINAYMKKEGLRDYTDQLIDTLALYRNYPTTIKTYRHILVDEYQDVNSTQITLLQTLQPPNLFVVGDPRQSIYGWRGSDIRFILTFTDRHPESEIIHLTTNYRSTTPIVDFINASIQTMHLPDLNAHNTGEKKITLTRFDTEQKEHTHLIETIKKDVLTPRDSIFILARTNRQLKTLAELLREHQILHIIRTDEIRHSTPTKKGAVTLATIHAIKGLEAQTIYLVGCSGQYFPCKGSDHPILDLLETQEYDKEEEERRLFYVAISRAKTALHLSYTGRSSTYFINSTMKRIIEKKNYQKKKKD